MYSYTLKAPEVYLATVGVIARSPPYVRALSIRAHRRAHRFDRGFDRSLDRKVSRHLPCFMNVLVFWSPTTSHPKGHVPTSFRPWNMASSSQPGLPGAPPDERSATYRAFQARKASQAKATGDWAQQWEFIYIPERPAEDGFEAQSEDLVFMHTSCNWAAKVTPATHPSRGHAIHRCKAAVSPSCLPPFILPVDEYTRSLFAGERGQNSAFGEAPDLMGGPGHAAQVPHLGWRGAAAAGDAYHIVRPGAQLVPLRDGCYIIW